jgi:tRNA A-37 threonylcarbamoyl transferase component Bud32/tetratricopeptide (TPR) repeat protein
MEQDMPTIRGYTLLCSLGRGGFAQVYAGREKSRSVGNSAADLDADGAIAIKIARPGADARLLREEQVLRAIGWPAAPACLDTGMTDRGARFIAMEYVGSDSLHRRLGVTIDSSDARMATTRERRIAMLSSICESVSRIHEMGIVHRDLKPEHIFFRRDGGVVIIDYGLARPMSEQSDLTPVELTRTGERIGTYHYMAPEQCLGRRTVSAATDTYALGIIAFQLLTGQLPFSGDAPASICQQHVLRRIPRPSRIAGLPVAFDDVVARALAKQPGGRFQNAIALARALHEAENQAGMERPAARDALGSGTTHPALRAQRPTALMWLRLTIAAPRFDALCRAHEAVVVALDGRDAVLAFPGANRTRAGVRAALDFAVAVAEEVGAMDWAVVHVAPLRVRRLRRGLHISGPALRVRDGWHPPADASGILLSADAARYVDASALAAAPPGHEQGFSRYRPADTHTRLPPFKPARVPLHGRDTFMTNLLRELDAARGKHRPHLATIVSRVGLGKTRILHQLAMELRCRDDVDVVYLRCQRDAHPEDMARQLVRVALTIDEHSVSRDTLALACARAGAGIERAGGIALGLLLGTIGERDEDGRRMLDVPGALRQAAAPAIAYALVQRARTRPLYVLLDDAHWAGQLALDAIELAAMRDAEMDDSSVELVFVVTAQHALLSSREHWGERCHAVPPMILEPLDALSARQLLLVLLQPLEYVPEAVLERISEIAAGVPLFLVELARTIRSGDAIRRESSEEAYRIATDEIIHTVDVRIAERMARHAMISIPAHLVPLAQLSAIWGDGITADDVMALQDILERRAREGRLPGRHDSVPAGADLGGERFFDIDAAAAMARLERRDILQRTGNGYQLRHPMLAQAIEILTPAMRRCEFHAAAFEYRQCVPERRTGTRLAHHAEESGALETAGALYLELADQASLRHHYVEGRELYTRALDLLPVHGALRGRALAGRGSASYRLHLLAESRDDLRASRALAEARGDERECARLLLEESTVCDFSHLHDEAACLSERAASEVERLGLDELVPEAAMVLGRADFHAQRIDQAIERLEAAVAGALTCRNERVRIMALPLLATALGYVERFDDAERRFTELMNLCQEVGDDFHLAVAHNNRMILCIQQHDIARAKHDLDRCTALTRRLGNAQLERAATINLAEELYWSDDLDSAYQLAERARDLHLRHMRQFLTHHDHLLLARIWCSRRDLTARESLAWIEANCKVDELPPVAKILLRMVRLVITALSEERFDTPAWETLAKDASRDTLLDEAIEVLVLAAETCDALGARRDANSWLQRAGARAHESPKWHARLLRLSRTLECPNC